MNWYRSYNESRIQLNRCNRITNQSTTQLQIQQLRLLEKSRQNKHLNRQQRQMVYQQKATNQYFLNNPYYKTDYRSLWKIDRDRTFFLDNFSQTKGIRSHPVKFNYGSLQSLRDSQRLLILMLCQVNLRLTNQCFVRGLTLRLYRHSTKKLRKYSNNQHPYLNLHLSYKLTKTKSTLLKSHNLS